MTDTAMTTAVATPAEPDGAPRLPVLDILRGIAILGILFMNINGMGNAMYREVGGAPQELGWTGLDQIAWWLREVLANGTARCMLEMLFGVGMVILTDRAATRMGKWRVLRAYAWRNIVLFLFGLVHVFVLLWAGDILHTYGLAALLAVLFRRWRPRWLILAGLSLAAFQLIGGGIQSWQSIHQREAALTVAAKQRAGQPVTPAELKTLAARRKRDADRAAERAKFAVAAAEEDRAKTGNASTWARSNWAIFIYVESLGLEVQFVWEALGTMLIGAALYKLGIIQGQRSRRWYGGMTIAGYAIGLSCRAWQGYAEIYWAHQPSMAYATSELARLATTLGHVGAVNLLLMSVAGARLLRPFDAAGKTALSVYIAQTLITLWVLYPPWGFALYGKQGWAGLMLTGLAINAALLWGANVWVRHFAIAPVEWAWRSIIARRRLPFRLRARPEQPEGVPMLA